LAKNRDILKLLLENGADANRTVGRETALMRACKRGDLETAQLLLEHGAAKSINFGRFWTGQETALYYASKYDHVACARLLLEHGAAVDPPSMLSAATSAEMRELLTNKVPQEDILYVLK
jgi:ankyrin repeat protein